jgi:hypothetical protein
MRLTPYAKTHYPPFADVVATAKAPKNVAYGAIGHGSLAHLAMPLWA